MSRLPPWWPLAALGALVAVLLVAGRVQSCRHAAQLQTVEAAGLRAAGQVVATEDNEALLAAALAENVLLQQRYAEALRAAPGARAVVIVRAAESTPARAPVSAGDPLTLKVDEVLLRTVGQNNVLVGTVEVRKADGSVVAQAPFSQATKLTADAPARTSKWGVGPYLSAGSDGWAAGAAVSVPGLRVPLLGWQAEFSLGAGIGPSGRVAGSVQMVLRP